MVSATKPFGIGRYSDWEPNAWFGLATSFDATAWPDVMETRGTMPWTSWIRVK